MNGPQIIFVVGIWVFSITDSRQQSIALYGPDVVKAGERVFIQCVIPATSGYVSLTWNGEPVCWTDLSRRPECGDARYSCFLETATFDLETFILVAIVKNATPQDSGRFTCRLDGQWQLEENKTLQVYEEETPEVKITDTVPEKRCKRTFICQTDLSFSKVKVLWRIIPPKTDSQPRNLTNITGTGVDLHVAPGLSEQMRTHVSYFMTADGEGRTSIRSTMEVDGVNEDVNCTLTCTVFNVLTPTIERVAVYNVILVSIGTNVPDCVFVTILSAGVGVTMTSWCALAIAANRRRRNAEEERRRREEEERGRIEGRRRQTESVSERALPPPLRRI